MAEEEKVEVAEEKKEEVVAEPVKADGEKHTLITFILSCAGLVVAAGWFIGGIAAIVLGAISLKRVGLADPQRNPYRVFKRIAKPVAIADIILGILSVIGWMIWLILVIVAAIAAAANGAASA